MNKKTYFERSLCTNAGLLSLPKKCIDLLLLSQTSTITYQQLAITDIHQGNEAAGRQALKRLEKNGLVQGRRMTPSISQSKYYALTPTGKERLCNYFTESYLSSLGINLARKLPSSGQQLLHRIRVNDFYTAFAAGPYSAPSPWLLEPPLPPGECEQTVPARCDGLLRTFYCNYYVEQDNGTQSAKVIRNKFRQYIESGMFSGTAEKAALVFCLSPGRASISLQKPSFSLYRLLLKFEKAWIYLEKERQIPLDILQFLRVLDISALRATFTLSEFEVFTNLKNLHSIDCLAEITALKKSYLHDTGYRQLLHNEMDAAFRKRLKSHFAFSAVRKRIDKMQELLLSGMRAYVLPNHRLKESLPFLMPQEYRLQEHLLKMLYYSGLNVDGWAFHMPLSVSGQFPFWFRFGFQKHESYSYIVIEDIAHDLGAKLRINHFLTNCGISFPIVFLLVCEPIDAASYFLEIEKLSHSHGNSHCQFCYLDSGHSVITGHNASIFMPDGTPALIEYDDFDCSIRVRPAEGGASS